MCDSSQLSRSAFEIIDVPPRRPVSRGTMFLGHVLREVILTTDLSRADVDFSRVLVSNLLCVVAKLPAQSRPALLCIQVREIFPQSLHQIRKSLKLPFFFSHQSRNVHTIS